MPEVLHFADISYILYLLVLLIGQLPILITGVTEWNDALCSTL